MTNGVLLIFTFLCCVFALSAEAGGHHLTCLNPTIKAEPGGNVTLQWVLDPPANLSACTVDISRDDLPVHDNIVHVCVRGRDHHRPQMAQYKKRTTLNHDDLLKGIVTLIISSVKLSDSGQYGVFVPELNVNSVIDLSVVPKDDSSTTKPPVEGVTEPDDRGQRIGSKRNDSSTTPAEGLNKSDGADGGNRRTVGAVIVAVVFVIFCIFTALILNGKKIKNCMRTNGGRREQEANVTNSTESIPLRTTTQDDLNHDGPGNNVQVV
ncbi:uncharacterized protein LOC125885477 [Epinephelus fuscoguttatus]|uniref:uncharacterized protein LOC125885477 n=1 Tax=Epinephelus fuscoguttatus TaxID=293821 RepID=UPI0020D0D03C|nr:uncharacterized protein LOC125885477 [Epinephelus fuscoguttatus]